MMPRHTLGTCCTHFGLAMGTRCPLQAQNVHDKTIVVWAAPIRVLAPLDTSWPDKWATGGKKAGSTFILPAIRTCSQFKVLIFCKGRVVTECFSLF
jgi:hypothetical protein